MDNKELKESNNKQVTPLAGETNMKNDIKADAEKKKLNDQRGENQQTKEAGKHQDPAQAAEGKNIKTNKASKKQGNGDHGNGDGEVKSLKLIGKNEMEDRKNGSEIRAKDKAEGKTGEGSKAEKDSTPEAKKNKKEDQRNTQGDPDEEGEIKEEQLAGPDPSHEGPSNSRLPLMPHPPLVPMPFPPPFMAQMGFCPPFLPMPPMMPPMVHGMGRNRMQPLPMGVPMIPQHFQIAPYGFVGNPMPMAPHHGKQLGRRRGAGYREEETDDNKALEEAGGRSPPGFSREHYKKWLKSLRRKHKSHRHGRRHRRHGHRHGSSARKHKRRYDYSSSSDAEDRERSRSVSSSSGGRSSSDEDESKKREKKKNKRTQRSSSSEGEQDSNEYGREGEKRRSQSPDDGPSSSKKARGDSPHGGGNHSPSGEAKP